MRARTRIQKCAEFFLLMKLCAGKHYYFSLSFFFFFTFTARSILQIQAKSNSLPFNKFWHSWCDAAVHTVLWSSSSHRERQRERELAAVISNFDTLWFNFDTNMNMTVKVKLTVFLSEGEIECVINSQWQSAQVMFFNSRVYFFKNVFTFKEKKARDNVFSVKLCTQVARYVSVFFLSLSVSLSHSGTESVLGWSHLSTMISEPFSVI